MNELEMVVMLGMVDGSRSKRETTHTLAGRGEIRDGLQPRSVTEISCGWYAVSEGRWESMLIGRNCKNCLYRNSCSISMISFVLCPVYF